MSVGDVDAVVADRGSLPLISTITQEAPLMGPFLLVFAPI